MSTWIADKLLGIRRLLSAGVEFPERGAINFVGGGVTVADDATNKRTEVTIATGAGGLTNITATAPMVVTTPSAGVRNLATPAATTSVAGLMPYADKRFLDSTHAGLGTNLPNSDSTILISAGAARKLVAGTLTAHHTTTLSLTDSVVGDQFTIIREDVSIYLFSVLDGGSLGTFFTFPAYQTGSVVFERVTLGWVPLDRGLGPVVAGPNSPARFRVSVGAAFVPRSNETILADSGDGDSITCPPVPSAFSQESIVFTVIGKVGGGGVVVTADGSDTIIGSATNAVAAGAIKQFHAECGEARWAVFTGVA
jgi:hypothetical protein